jgi:hypothetical protein
MAESQQDRIEDKSPSEVVPAQPAGNGKSDSPGGTPEQQALSDKWYQRYMNPPVRFKKVKGKPRNVEVDRDDDFHKVKMCEAFGTADPHLQIHLLNQALAPLLNVVLPCGPHGDVTVHAANVLASILTDIKPQNALEGMLAAQMVVINGLLMDAARRAAWPEQTVAARQSYMDCVVKLSRMFIAQMDALKKYRGGGSQKMVVEHVHVNEGGKAIVGNVRTEGGDAAQRNQL